MTSFDSISIYGKLLTAGTSACIADALTFPLDTAKVRLQIQGEAAAVVENGTVAVLRSEARAAQFGLFGTIANMVRHEGARSLYSGLSAGLQRQMCFASVRIGLYDTFKAFYQQLIDGNSRTGSLNIGARVAAGLTTGGLAVLLAQPTDVVKVRFQACITGNSTARYSSTLQAYKLIASKEGLKGLWKGFCATIVASPVDVVKTRYMNSTKGQYKGAVDCAIRMFMQEGGKAFYKGFIPSFCRLVSWNIMMWVTYEQMKIFVGKSVAELNKH